MTREKIIKERDAIIKEHGEWTAHNIRLGDDAYTFDNDHPRFTERLGHGPHARRIVQIVADTIKKPINECRVLDLACLEGLYAIEFALQSAGEVVGIEGRESGVVKSQFAAKTLGLTNVNFVQDDVRNLSVEKYGSFDVILCLGIWYHIDTPDSFHFMEKMSETCRSLLIVDTHVATRAAISHDHRQTTFHGTNFVEHEPEATATERLKAAWASLDNDNSFWFTRPSLHNLIVMNGFTSVFTCNAPAVDDWADRDTIVAIKGKPVDIHSVPTTPHIKMESEINNKGVHPSQRPPETFASRVARKLGIER